MADDTKRDDWLAGGAGSATASVKKDEPVQAGGDLFNSFGTISTSRQEKAELAAQKKEDEPKFHRREINHRLMQEDAGGVATPSSSKEKVPGGPGSQWRMTKLRRVFETASSESRPVLDVARERYDSLQEFEDAKEERRILDARSDRRDSRGAGRQERSSGSSTPQGPSGGGGRYMFTSDAALNSSTSSRPGSRAGFRRPGEEGGEGPRTPGGEGMAPGTLHKADLLRRSSSFQSLASGPPTPISSVLPPTISRPAQDDVPAGPPAADGKPVLSASELNKLQAAVLKAKLMEKPNAVKLEQEYDVEMRRSRAAGSLSGGGGHTGGESGADAKGKGRADKVEMVPTVDGRGRLYDVGLGAKEDPLAPGAKRKRPEKFETHDPKTGEMLRLNADDDSISLSELVRQERFGAGSADQKNLDMELAKAIAGDGRFVEGNDYLDENADKLARKKLKTDASKRLFAINDYARTKKALDSCQFCPANEDGPPRAAVIAMGSRAFLACTQTEELVEGHCLIVPTQHTLTTLEGDDDVWDEIRNFMKTLIKMFAEQDKGVLFYETVVSFKQQRHTYIEAVPVPWDLFDDAPAYFREGILASESEWSQHKKLIDFSARPGGFRRALVANLPYFMVQWDYKGEKGFGHVIEGVDDAGGKPGDAEDQGVVDEGDKGGKFPRYFAAEIIGSILDLEPRKWRKPKRVDSRQNQQRIDKFLKSYAAYDWTGALGRKAV